MTRHLQRLLRLRDPGYNKIPASTLSTVDTTHHSALCIMLVTSTTLTITRVYLAEKKTDTSFCHVPFNETQCTQLLGTKYGQCLGVRVTCCVTDL